MYLQKMQEKSEQLLHFFAHLASAAFLAMLRRLAGDSLFARALPPFSPPSLPRATAAGFFSRVVCSTIDAAS
jgi:hypothetical protein